MAEAKNPLDTVLSTLLTRDSLKLVVAAAVVGCLVSWGKHAENVNEATKAIVWGKFESLVVAPQQIPVDMSSAKVIGGVTSTGGRVSTHYRFWTGLQSEDWLFLNGERTNMVCSSILSAFARHNGAAHNQMAPETLDMVVSALDGRTVAIDAYVPKFTEAPNTDGLSLCPGFRYDEVSRTLKVGSRTVAIFSPNQKQLLTSAGEPQAAH